MRDGRAYVTGETTSTDYPTTSGAFDTSFNGPIFGTDAFVTKLNASGSRLAYSTFLGGTRLEGEAEVPGGVAIAVDGSGRAYVTGWTLCSDFPITDGAFDTTFNSGDAFVTKLPTG